jgi:hypothetical protein
MSNQIPQCNRCGSPLEKGPHIHVEQCLKSKMQDCAALRHTLVLVALEADAIRRELGHMRGLLWRAVDLAGGELVVADRGSTPVPEGYSRNLISERTEANDGFHLKAAVEAPPPAIA